MYRILVWILCFMLCVPQLAYTADAGSTTQENVDVDGVMCPKVNLFGDIMFTKVCWSCMLPISWGGSALLSGEVDFPEGANTSYTCYCEGDTAVSDFGTVGIALGLWQPTRVLEVVRKPYCYPALWGADLSGGITKKESLRFGGRNQDVGPEIEMENKSYYEVHMYAFPLLNILSMLDIPRCTVDYHATYDLLYMSEAFPHWSDDVMALLINPEAALFANPVAQLAQIPDCTKASLSSNSFDEIFWEMGCWGGTYPLTGTSIGQTSVVSNSSLVSARFLFLIGRMGLLTRTVGEDVMCKTEFMPIMRKSQYRMQQLWPVAEAGDPAEEFQSRNSSSDNDYSFANGNCQDGDSKCVDVSRLPDKCCHNIGASTFTWGEHRHIPGTGEDFVYLVWQWTDCCVGLVGI